MSQPLTTPLYIGGKERQTADWIAIADPARPGVVVGYCAAATTRDVSDAVASAKAAYPAWAALSPQQRAERMLTALGGIAENRDDDAAILSQEYGKIRFEAWIDSLVLELRWKLALSHADEVNASKVLPPIPGAIPVETTVAYQPLGVVTIIVPFNWPVAILGAALPHALLAGNVVIVKPPLTAPLATTRIVQRIAKQLPPGVLNVVTGADASMSALIRNRDVAKLCFTGSVNSGKKMMELASHSLTRVTLELGGNDAAIVLKDAMLDDVHLDRLFAAIYDITGQICMNANRLFAHKSRVDEVVEGLSARLHKVKLGYGLDQGTTMGPPTAPVASAANWSADISGSTTTAPHASTCARPSAA
jgi:acyl-CoA reductase-like NAD-dependent aldehyde dehydrogenase